MKLVRGSVFNENMQWDNRDGEYSGSGINEWKDSMLEKFLNVDYYDKINNANNYGLKNSSHMMIENTKFYLGGHVYNSFFGTTEEMYIWERGKEVFNPENNESPCYNEITDNGACILRSIEWIGNIALLYPSDVYMTYAKGIDNVCYNDPSSCSEKKYQDWNGKYVDRENPGFPQMSWVYISNPGDNNNHVYLSLISSFSAGIMTNAFFRINSMGNLSYGNTNNVSSIRPTLYLSSQVNIIDGDGSINNPYKLSL